MSAGARHVEESEDDAGDDQVRAYALRAALCAAWSGAGGAGVAGAGDDALDLAGDGRSALGGDGLQPAGRPGFRCRQSADPDAGDSGRTAEQPLRSGLHDRRGGALLSGGGDAQSARPEALTARARVGALLFVYEALHRAVARRAGMGAGDCADRGLDCGARRDRCADAAAAEPRGAALDGGVRHHLCLSG